MGNTQTRVLAVRGGERSVSLPTRLWVVARQTSHGRRMLLALVMMFLLSKVVRHRLVMLLWRLHYQLTAEKPRVVYQHTPANVRLLQRCVTMTQKKYYPPWYLFNGHLQTLALARANDTEIDPVIQYERQLLNLPDGGQVSLDWALLTRSNDRNAPLLANLNPSKRTMLILPGLTGGSSEHYIRCAVERLNAIGWQAVVLNARGCAQTPVLTPQLFCCAYTDDLRYVVQYLTDKYAFTTEAFMALGFSMGSNVLVKYLGEEGDKTPLTAAISVGNPFDLVKCSANFSGTLFNRLTYDKVLTNNLQELLFKKSNAHEIFQTHPEVDLVAVKNAKTVYDFDELFTRVIFNYPSANSYYADASSVKKLPLVTVPLLCISAEDDPISVSTALPEVTENTKKNANVILCVTKSGGHLGFYEDIIAADDDDKDKVRSKKRKEMWSVKLIAEFAESVRLRKLEDEQSGLN